MNMPNREFYSPYKASHHLDRIDKLRKGELIYPTQAQIDLTNACNHRCPYCFYRCARGAVLNALFNESDFIPIERMFSLLPELLELGISAVQFTGGGEPMKHPNFYDIIERTIMLGLDFSLVTNAALADLSKVHLFKHASWVRVSLDAACAETYSNCQSAPKEDFYKSLEFIRALVEQCPKTVTGISFVANPINYNEILEFTGLAKQLGVSNVRFSVAYTPQGIDLYKDKWNEIEAIAQEAKKLESADFKVFNFIVAHLENLDLHHKSYDVCGYQHFTVAIGADQEVYPCCTLKYNSLSKFGNLRDKSFKDIWLGSIRGMWLKKNYLKTICDKHPCWMDKKNEFISYLIANDAPHLNYI